MTLVVVMKATIALTIAIAFAIVAKRASAATRHAALIAGLAAALAMPLLVALVPAMEVTWVQPRAIAAALPSMPQTIAPATPVRESNPPSPRPNVLFIVWLAGCVAVASTRAQSLIHALRITRRARPWGSVFLSDDVDQPMTIGSRILLPTSAPEWDATQLSGVLLHERAHVERRDSLLGILTDAACAVYWFHPLVWIAARRALFERERACDEAVLAAGVRRIDYASALLAVARDLSFAAGMAVAAKPRLEERVRAVLDFELRVPHRGARAFVVIAAIAVAPFVAALTPLAIIRPLLGEPDLLNDSITSPFSEWIGAPEIDVPATGIDAPLIARMKQAAATPPRADDDLVPDRARWALGRVRNGALVEPLLESLRDDDWRIRAYAAWALGVSRDRRATAPLVALLDDPIWRMRAMAAYGLSEIADPVARPAMQRALSDRAWQVRLCAVDYFAALHERDVLRAMTDDRHIAVRDAAENGLQR